MMRRILPIAAVTALAGAGVVAYGVAQPVRSDLVVGNAPQAVEDRFVPDPPGLSVETWASGLEVPWAIVFLPDGRALVSERPGRIRVLESDGTVRDTPYATLPVAARGEGGLMGLALHPDFPATPHVYAMYTAEGPVNRVVRLHHRGPVGNDEEIILDGIPAGRVHNGGGIAFGPDGMLYITTGDAQEPERSQDTTSLAGKILRVTPDGAVPDDNPMGGNPVWAWGLRNPQGLAWHPETGDLFATEHGPSGEWGVQAHDEINIIRPGENYGWPVVVSDAGRADLTPPLASWPGQSVPPAGAAFLGGDLYFATLRSQALVRLNLERDGDAWRAAGIERLFASGGRSGTYGRLRAAVTGPDGALYVSTSNRDGRGNPHAEDDRILRLRPAP